MLDIKQVDRSDFADAKAVAEVLAATSLNWKPTAAEVFKNWETTPPHVEEIRYLVWDSGRPIGYAQVGTYRYVVDPGRVTATIRVMPEHRGRGIATMLADILKEWVSQRPIREMWTSIDITPEGIAVAPAGEAMARKLGFEPRESRFESRLDTSTFDIELATKAVAAQQLAGVTVTTLAALLEDNTWRDRNWAYELYELDTLAMADEPTEQGGEAPDFDTWHAEYLGGHDEAGIIVAIANGQFVGLTVHWIENEVLLVAATAVHPAFRGRGIARALKAVGAAYGKSTNRDLRAYNADANVHIVSLNRSLGFVRQAGQMFWKRTMETSPEK